MKFLLSLQNFKKALIVSVLLLCALVSLGCAQPERERTFVFSAVVSCDGGQTSIYNSTTVQIHASDQTETEAFNLAIDGFVNNCTNPHVIPLFWKELD